MPAKPDKPRTLHERLWTQFHGNIVSGQWPPGFHLPYETELAEQHGVSRMTMNKVLSQLAREGFLVRRRKLGTFVAQLRAEAAVMELHDVETEVRALGLSWSFRLLDRRFRAATSEEASEGCFSAGQEVLALRGVHYASSSPFCFEERIINPAAAPLACDQDFSSVAPGKWLRREIPWSAAQSRIRAVNPAEPMARELGIGSREACLEVTRRTDIYGLWVTLVQHTYLGARHQLRASFSPGAEEGMAGGMV